MTVDASQGIGRVIIDENSNIGFENKDYKIGDVITFESGANNKVRIYNAQQQDSVNFLISFSNAYRIQSGILLGAVGLL